MNKGDKRQKKLEKLLKHHAQVFYQLGFREDEREDTTRGGPTVRRVVYLGIGVPTEPPAGPRQEVVKPPQLPGMPPTTPPTTPPVPTIPTPPGGGSGGTNVGPPTGGQGGGGRGGTGQGNNNSNQGDSGSRGGGTGSGGASGGSGSGGSFGGIKDSIQSVEDRLERARGSPQVDKGNLKYAMCVREGKDPAVCECLDAGGDVLACLKAKGMEPRSYEECTKLGLAPNVCMKYSKSTPTPQPPPSPPPKGEEKSPSPPQPKTPKHVFVEQTPEWQAVHGAMKEKTPTPQPPPSPPPKGEEKSPSPPQPK
ncbi:MAG: hypothetical protein ACK4SY_09955, partial [Pyrobaculum sp.]